MADVTIKVNGLNELNTYLTNLPSQLNKHFTIAQKEFASFVQKSAKIRAPRLTANLSQSIKFYPRKKNEIVISCDSPYAYFQEFGFRPHMIFPSMDNRNGIKLRDLGFDHPVWVSKHHPFLTPAVEMGIAKLPMMLNQAADEAIK